MKKDPLLRFVGGYFPSDFARPSKPRNEEHNSIVQVEITVGTKKSTVPIKK